MGADVALIRKATASAGVPAHLSVSIPARWTNTHTSVHALEPIRTLGAVNLSQALIKNGSKVCQYVNLQLNAANTVLLWH